MNKLPQYWQVQHDGSELFNNTVVKYLNTFATDEEFWWGNSYSSYYGKYRELPLKGFCNENPMNCPILTLDEFIELTKHFKFGR